MKFPYLFCLAVAVFTSAIAQTTDESAPQFIFLPPGLQFAPLKANIQEPRIGVFKFLDASEMKVDIGNAIDVFGLDLPASNVKFRVGIDFWAYAFTTGAQGLRLQIDAVDGFFGGNLSVSKDYGSQQLEARLRILHQSAHLVDGHYIESTHSWIDNRQPIPFTRDFGELTVAHNVAQSYWRTRYYAGMAYATLVRPDDVQRYSYLAGIEASTDKILGGVSGAPTNIFVAYQIDIRGTPTYASTNQIQLGCKFGKWYGKGPTFYLAYYSGQHMFAEYYDERITTIGAGFSMDWD